MPLVGSMAERRKKARTPEGFTGESGVTKRLVPEEKSLLEKGKEAIIGAGQDIKGQFMEQAQAFKENPLSLGVPKPKAGETITSLAFPGSLNAFRTGMIKEIIELGGNPANLDQLTTAGIKTIRDRLIRGGAIPGELSLARDAEITSRLARIKETVPGELVKNGAGGIGRAWNPKNLKLTKDMMFKIGMGITATSLVGGLAAAWMIGTHDKAEANEPALFWAMQAAKGDNIETIDAAAAAIIEITDEKNLTLLERLPIVGGAFQKLRGNVKEVPVALQVLEDRKKKLENPEKSESDIIKENQDAYLARKEELETRDRREREQAQIRQQQRIEESQIRQQERERTASIEETERIEQSQIRIALAEDRLFKARQEETARLQKENTENWIKYLELKAKFAEESGRSSLSFGLLR